VSDETRREQEAARAAGFTPDASAGGTGGAAQRPPLREEEENPAAIATGMTLADISIRNHVFAWMLMAGLILFGLICFTGFGGVVKGLGISLNPDVDFPIVNVQVTYEGASPEVMESDVVDPIEDAITSVEGVKQISSTSRQGNANITVEFEISRNIDAALQDVQTRVAQAARRLPREIEPPIISKNNPEDSPIMWFSISGTRSPVYMADYIRNVIRPQLQTIEGVGEVFIGGYRERNVRVWFDAPRLESQGLTVLDVITAIQREHLEVPAGRIETPQREMNVRAEGEALDLKGFRELVVAYREGTPVRLQDVSVVEDGLEDRRRVARANGEPSIGFGIRKLRGANAVEVGARAKARLEQIKADLPEGVNIGIRFDSTVFIERAIDEILMTLLLAALLTGAVCWLFLGSWSTTINVLLAIPTSILGTFIVMYFFNFTLNTFTVLGLTLVVGIVVDDAIMVLENIYRHREHGEGKVKAASVGAREITFAAAATTAAIVAIFMPVAFMKGIIGKFFFQFGVTISVAVLISLLEALTLTPMRCSRFLEVGERRGRLGQTVDRLFARLSARYLKALEPALHHRIFVVAGAALFFVASLFIYPLLRQEFVPPQDTNSFQIRFQTPVGTSLDVTEEKMRQVEGILSSRGEVEGNFSFIGGFGGGEVNTGMMFVSMKEPRDRPVDEKAGHRLSQQELMNVIRGATSSIPGIRAALVDPSQQGFSASRGGGFPIELSIRGRDWNQLAGYSRQIMEEMAQSGKVTDVNSDYQVGMPEVRVVPDRDKAADLGVSMADIGNTINAAIGGTRVGKYKEGGRRYDIRVRLLGPQRQRPEDINGLYVRGATGSMTRLSDLVKIEQQPTLQAITRKDRERAITIFGNVAPGASQADAIAVSEKIARGILPEGYRAIPSGTSQAFAESFESLRFAFVLGLIVAYMVLAAQFNAFTHPLTVLLALPFSITGALFMLWAFGQSMNVYSMLGLILLMGIAKKNSIMLVDFTNQIRDRGVERHAAIMQACPIRLRPILMTSASTIAGAIPPALALGAGAETQRPMAIALIGGMLVSTALTLFVVPAFYSLLDDAVVWNEQRRRQGTGLVAGLRALRPRHAGSGTIDDAHPLG
jgi:hydrophobe/amphiphile efflux-1 (HAE1) family protein